MLRDHCLDQLHPPCCDRANQRFLEEDLPPVENRKRPTVGVHPVLTLERLPVIQLDQNPGPVAEAASPYLSSKGLRALTCSWHCWIEYPVLQTKCRESADAVTSFGLVRATV